MMMVVAEDERRFRQLGSTLNHLRSITSAEVMAAFSRPRRRAILFLLPSLLSLSLSSLVRLLSSRRVFGAVLYNSACPFVHVPTTIASGVSLGERCPSLPETARHLKHV